MTDERELRPDHEMDGRVGTWLTDTDLSPDEAHAGLDRLLDEFPVTPQARRRFLGRWLDRDEGAGRRTTEHDHPPNTNRRNTFMLSATVITAVLAILAIAVNVIDTDAPAPPGAEAGTHVVAADGTGDFTTIGAAVDAAADGDTIAIKPGTYTEAVTIDKNITLFGDGPREEVVISAPEGGPVRDIDFSWLSSAPYALLLVNSDGEVRDLTLAGEASRLFIEGGAATIRGVLFDQVGSAYTGSAVAGAVVVQGLGTPTFTENELIGGGGLSAFADADPVFERNIVHQSGAISGDFGAHAIIRDNTITGAGRQGITFLGATSATVVGNTIEDKEWGITTGDGINVTTAADGSTFEPTIEGNSVSGAKQYAINLRGGSPQVVDNTLVGDRIGVNLSQSSATVSGNDISGFLAGVVIIGGDPTLTDNTITANGRGLAVSGAGTQVTLSGNTICDNELNLNDPDGAVLGAEGNEICEDAPPEE